MAYIAWSANADRLQKHERRTAEELVRQGVAPPGMSLIPTTRELLAADGRIMGYLRDGVAPAEQAELDRAEAAELATLRAERDREELEELRARRARREAAKAAEAGAPATEGGVTATLTTGI